MTTTSGPPHLALLATPGMGHLIPLAELAKRVVSRHGATATLLTFESTASPTQRAFLASLPPSISPRPLPPVDLSDLPRGAAIETLMHEECRRSLPALTAVLAELRRTTRLVAFVADMFGVDSLDAARDAGVERRCLFMPVNLHSLALILHLPEVLASVPGEFRDLEEPVRLPGCVPISGADIVASLQDRSSPAYGSVVHIAVTPTRCLSTPSTPSSRRPPRFSQTPERPPVFPIGLLIRTTAGIESSDEAAASAPHRPHPPRAACLEWLDRQPAGSVVFVSFGSGGALPAEQMRELALGLELSGQRFLWVVRSPSDEEAGSLSDNYYDAASKKDPFAYLPEGFVERTKDVGLVVPSWAPQTEVLGHDATGGFLTHCGWNSALESLVHGVPMLAWPLFAEQRMNAVVLAEGVGAAIRLPEVKDKEAIAVAVRELMVMTGEGKGAVVRAKVVELQKAAAEGLREGGAATMALDEVVQSWVEKTSQDLDQKSDMDDEGIDLIETNMQS
ncbi:LOW QUALITY PROTEIN: hypothetical protein U9M48_002281 [Paspalum notatum var. saurae]|uniref:Glycosyltransferase n=1 Tax=Paspalum notatum var. saurae TaxID=547442 RepID=A0AAQ3PGY6_PASNO